MRSGYTDKFFAKTPLCTVNMKNKNPSFVNWFIWIFNIKSDV